MKSFRAARMLLLGCTFILSAVAQNWISVGVKGGIPLTDSFADRTFDYAFYTVQLPFGPPSVVSQTTRVYSGSKYFVLGPTVEVQLPFGLAFEADGLYRPMEAKIQQPTSLASFLLGLGSTTLSNRIDTWEFPLLAKYRLSLPIMRPYFEAGPTFRTLSASVAQHISGTGFSAGIGLETHIRRLRVAPEVRYTRWSSDASDTAPFYIPRRNQVELLLYLLY